MKTVTRLFRSSLGQKYVMAVTGCALFLFVVLHLLGNLQIFLGPNPLNAYAHFLQSAPELLWTARLGLLLMVILHLGAAVRLTLENRAARPAGYGNYRPVAASYASRTMFMSGLIIAAFVIYHLLHFTVQNEAINFTGQDFKLLRQSVPGGPPRPDVYQMMIVGFSNIWVSAFYLIGVGLLLLHLSHGASSMFQSVGWKNKKYGPLLDRLALLSAWILFLGYSAIPVAVLLDKKWNLVRIFE